MSLDKPDPNEPLVAEMVEETLAKVRHLLPPEALEDLREEMRAFALTHPGLRTMVQRLRPRAAPDASGTKPKEGEPTEELPRAAGGEDR